MGYLDNNGLAHFWAQLKNKFAAKTHTHSTKDLVRPTSMQGLNDVTLQTLINTTRANRLAFLPADQIIIEKTTDGGSTWVDAGVSDAAKLGLFSEVRQAVNIPLLNGVKSTQCGLRITITAMKYNVPSGTSETGKYAYWNSSYISSAERYCQLKEMYFWVNVNSDTIGVKVERANGNASTNWTTIFNDTSFYMTGWSGCDYIRFSQGVFGGGTNQTSQPWNYRITLMTRGVGGTDTMATTYTTSAQQIFEIRAYGDTWWTKANEYMANDKLYTHDANKNATFPADVYATQFVGNLKGGIVPTSVRPSSANTARTGTSALVHILATASMTTGKPMADGHIIEMDWDNAGGYKGQLYVPNENASHNKHLQFRSQDAGTWGEWITVLDSITSVNAATVNNHSVNSDVPANAKFTDTTYSEATATSAGLMSAADKATLDAMSGGSTAVETLYNSSTWTILRWGRVIMVQMHGATATAGASTALLDVLSSYKPSYNVSTTVADSSGSARFARLWVSATDGKVYLAAAGYTTSAVWYGTLTYIC